MSLSISTPAGPDWGSHTAWTRLARSRRQLTADLTRGADPRTITTDRAAVQHCQDQVRRLRPGHVLDVTA